MSKCLTTEKEKRMQIPKLREQRGVELDTVMNEQVEPDGEQVCSERQHQVMSRGEKFTEGEW